MPVVTAIAARPAAPATLAAQVVPDGTAFLRNLGPEGRNPPRKLKAKVLERCWAYLRGADASLFRREA
jgi:hypothetical protein